MFELRLKSGRRVVGVLGGLAEIEDIDGALKSLGKIDRKYRTISQLFDASRIAGSEHLIHAARLALVAHATRTNFASSINVELVCWAAGTKQIDRAFKAVGLCRGRGTVALLTIGEKRHQVGRAQAEAIRRLRIDRDDGVIDITSRKIATLLKLFFISKPELKMADVRKLVLERVALLSLQR